ncbi:MAG: group II truncated hemoglobin [Rhodanobacter sp.]
MTAPTTVPTLYEWAGGRDAFEKLTKVFYQRIPDEPLLAPLFAHMAADHSRLVASFIVEVLGGPALYSQERAGHHAMIRQHLGKHLTEAHRVRWMTLLLECADAVGLPDDPEFRSAFVGYLEWGTRLALINSQLDSLPDADSAMPRWGWGEVGGPYQEAEVVNVI